MVGGGAGEGRGGLVSDGDRASVWEDEKVLDMMVLMAAQQYECA